MARILVVDDEGVIRKLVSASLKRGGHDVEVAANGVEATVLYAAWLAEGREFHYVLTDVEMPECDGLELARMLCAQCAQCKIVIMSSDDEPDRVQAARDVGGTFVHKASSDFMRRIVELSM